MNGMPFQLQQNEGIEELASVITKQVRTAASSDQRRGLHSKCILIHDKFILHGFSTRRP